MKPRTRFIKSVIDAARSCDTDLPWSRRRPAARRARRRLA